LKPVANGGLWDDQFDFASRFTALSRPIDSSGQLRWQSWSASMQAMGTGLGFATPGKMASQLDFGTLRGAL